MHRTDRYSDQIIERLCVAFALAIALLLISAASSATETWRDLIVAPEYRCSKYDRRADYQYSQSVELDIIASIGKIYEPYTGTCFNSRFDTDIEHIVATSEAHDSGLCAADRQTRMRFASDLRNLTLASPRVNRNLKKGKDAAEWMPQKNRCWFAARILEVRLAYNLTIDRREADALEQVLINCDSFDMVVNSCSSPATEIDDLPNTASSDASALGLQR